MKKILTIVLLCILLFNWGGYHLLSYLLQSRSNVQLESQLDADKYQESDLITVKVPSKYISPYTKSLQFERVDGQIEISGVQYNFVKRRLFNDSIEMRCIPNHRSTQLKNDNIDFFKLVNDLQHPLQGKKTSVNKSFSEDFCAVQQNFSINIFLTRHTKLFFHHISACPVDLSLSIERPPDKIV